MPSQLGGKEMRLYLHIPFEGKDALGYYLFQTPYHRLKMKKLILQGE